MYRTFLAVSAVSVLASLGPSSAADPERGATLAADCAACHGPAGVSVSGDIPNLAAQKAGYLAAQLQEFRDGKRTSPYMNPVAAGLSDADIEDLAAHFASLPGAEPGAEGAAAMAMDGTRPVFPAGYKESYVKYHVIDFPARGQVRHYWADPASAAAAAAGQPLPDGATMFVEVFKARLGADGQPVTGADGHFEADALALFTAMQKIAGAGAEVPGIIANGDWRYAVFNTDGGHKGGTNEAKCLACHKPEDARDYVFTLEQLTAFAKAN
ncbi:MAG TPA: cytochrome P460 family protein [Thermohalobaculum sp.]|nr:cytochrome P460 family protein [Thermohalobaculum sp.]